MNALKYLSVIACSLALVACGKVFEREEIPNTFELPSGTEVLVRPADDFSPENLKADSGFAGVLAEALYYRREAIDEEGEVFEKKTLIAPEGMPVHAKVVSEKSSGEEGERLGLKLTSITFHGGMSFDVTSEPVLEFGSGTDEIKFKLAKPADVALVIDFRKKEKEEKEAKKS